jgi:predicted transcriptional regulator
MRRTTVKLPDDLDAKLRHEAARRESTIGEVTREAIEAHVGGVATPDRCQSGTKRKP